MRSVVLIVVWMLNLIIVTSSMVYTQINENDKDSQWWLMSEEEFNKWIEKQLASEETKKVLQVIWASKSQSELLDLLIKYQDLYFCKNVICFLLRYYANEDALPILKKVVQEELKVKEYIDKEIKRGNKELRFRILNLEKRNFELYPAWRIYEYLRAKICQDKFEQIKEVEEKFQEAVKMLTEGRTTLIKDDIETNSTKIRCIGLRYLLSINDERVIPYLFWEMETPAEIFCSSYITWYDLSAEEHKLLGSVDKVLIEKYGKKAEDFALARLKNAVGDFEKTDKWTQSGTTAFMFLTRNVGSKDALKIIVNIVMKYQDVKSFEQKATPHRLLAYFCDYVTEVDTLKYDKSTIIECLSPLIEKDKIVLTSILEVFKHLKTKELLPMLKNRLMKEKSQDPVSSIVRELERCIDSIEKENTNGEK